MTGTHAGRPPVTLIAPKEAPTIASAKQTRATSRSVPRSSVRQNESTLSQLESGAGNPGVETLWALAVALGLPFSRLVDPPRRNVQVIRAAEGLVIYSERANYAATLLASCPPGARRDIYRMTVQPGEPRLSEPHLPGSTEHLVLSTGRALAGPAGEPVELGPGDYATYPGDEPHIFKALEPGTTAVLVMEHI